MDVYSTPQYKVDQTDEISGESGFRQNLSQIHRVVKNLSA